MTNDFMLSLNSKEFEVTLKSLGGSSKHTCPAWWAISDSVPGSRAHRGHISHGLLTLRLEPETSRSQAQFLNTL